MKRKSKQPLQPLLILSWKLGKLYEKKCMQAARPFGFTRNEVDVLLFLANNRDLNTAMDIVQYRHISKSLVSKSIEHLVSLGYLETKQDSANRRYIRLYLTPQAERAAAALQKGQESFFDVIDDAISPDERDLLLHAFERLSAKIDEQL